MGHRFELFVALRYLTAKRKQAMVSVITVISVLGVAGGVMSLVIAAAATNGFQSTLQSKLLSATPHVTILEKEVSAGIENWRGLAAKLRLVPNVKQVAPSLFDGVMFNGPVQSTGGFLKGIASPREVPLPAPLQHLKAGRFEDWDEARGYPPIILGSNLAQQIGMKLDSIVGVLSRHGDLSPLGAKHILHQFRVVAIFESGLYDFDNNFAYASLKDVQRVLGLPDVVSAVEVELDDVYKAPQAELAVAKVLPENLSTTNWMIQNKPLFAALRAERVMAMIVISLMLLQSGLCILITLFMLVMEKNRDIALLMSMGARRRQIARIFRYQGLLIGAAGTVIGLVVGHLLCYFAERGQWISLDEAVYSLGHLPFLPRALDSVWIAGVAVLTSLLATLYPARAATSIAPAEALRYE